MNTRWMESMDGFNNGRRLLHPVCRAHTFAFALQLFVGKPVFKANQCVNGKVSPSGCACFVRAPDTIVAGYTIG